MSAQGSDEAGEAAGGQYGGLCAQFLFHPVDDAVQHAGVAVHNAAAHTVNGIFTDDTWRNVKADVGQLGGAACLLYTSRCV